MATLKLTVVNNAPSSKDSLVFLKAPTVSGPGAGLLLDAWRVAPRTFGDAYDSQPPQAADLGHETSPGGYASFSPSGVIDPISRLGGMGIGGPSPVATFTAVRGEFLNITPVETPAPKDEA